jgi:YD repeat-containing protein
MPTLNAAPPFTRVAVDSIQSVMRRLRDTARSVGGAIARGALAWAVGGAHLGAHATLLNERTMPSKIRIQCLGLLGVALYLLFAGHASSQQKIVAPLIGWAMPGNQGGKPYPPNGVESCNQRVASLRQGNPSIDIYDIHYVRGPSYASEDPTNWTPAPWLDAGRCEDNQARSWGFPIQAYYCMEGYEVGPYDLSNTSTTCCIFGQLDPPGGPSGRWVGVFTSTPESTCFVNGPETGKNQGCPKGGAAGGNPINFGFPNKFQTETMFSTSPPLAFHYNSAPIGALGTAGSAPLGYGWSHTYSRTLLIATTPQRSTAYSAREDGSLTTFNLVGGLWVPDADVVDRLTNVLTGSTVTGRTLRRADDSVERYDANGRLLSITTRAGVVQTMAYNATGQLITVTDSYGRMLGFTYHAANATAGANNIATATDHFGNVISYTYDTGSNLNTATLPSGGVKTYVFNETGFAYRNALTGIVDENGGRFATYKYDSIGRPISTEHANNVNKYTVGYQGAGYLWNSNSVVTDSLGVQRSYAFEHLQRVVKAIGVTEPCPSCGGDQSQGTVFDVNGNIKGKKDFNGNFTSYSYDTVRNLETSRTEGQAAPVCAGNPATVKYYSTNLTQYNAGCSYGVCFSESGGFPGSQQTSTIGLGGGNHTSNPHHQHHLARHLPPAADHHRARRRSHGGRRGWHQDHRLHLRQRWQPAHQKSHRPEERWHLGCRSNGASHVDVDLQRPRPNPHS